jgi:hypothetical protein
MATLLQDSFAVEMMEFEPSEADLRDYAQWSAEVELRWQVEREDRIDALEKIRRADFDNARSAACQIRGMASSLRCQGLSGMAERLLAASEDMMAVVQKYA